MFGKLEKIRFVNKARWSLVLRKNVYLYHKNDAQLLSKALLKVSIKLQQL